MDSKNTEIRVRLSDLIYAMQKKWTLILLTTIVGILVGFGINGMSYLQGTSMDYEITCSFAISAQTKTGTFSGNSAYMTSADLYLAQDLVDASSYVMKSKQVLTTAMKKAGVRDQNWSTVKENLLLTRYNDTQIVEMELDWNDATKGKALASAILDEAKKELPTALQIGSITVIDEPQISKQPGGFSYAMIWVLLGVLGLGAGISLVLLDLVLRPTLINPDDTETLFGLIKIGEVQKDKDFFESQTPDTITYCNSTNRTEQQISSATYILQNLVNKKLEHHCIYFTSASAGEGKTALLATIGVRIADMGKKVLLLDMNIQNPVLGNLFLEKVNYYQSINALYRNDADPEDVIYHVTGCLDVIPMVVERETFRFDDEAVAIVKKIADQYDYILIDAPAVGLCSDVLKLNAVAEAAVLVVRYDYVTIQNIQAAGETLGKSGIHVMGVLINGIKAKTPDAGDFRTPAKKPGRYVPGSDHVTRKKHSASESILERLDADQEESGTGGTLTQEEALRCLYTGQKAGDDHADSDSEGSTKS